MTRPDGKTPESTANPVRMLRFDLSVVNGRRPTRPAALERWINQRLGSTVLEEKSDLTSASNFRRRLRAGYLRGRSLSLAASTDLAPRG